jgi:hypothetical protein
MKTSALRRAVLYNGIIVSQRPRRWWRWLIVRRWFLERPRPGGTATWLSERRLSGSRFDRDQRRAERSGECRRPQQRWQRSQWRCPPAGAVGPQATVAAGTGDPALNAAGVRSVPADNPASGWETAPKTGGVIGGNIGLAEPPPSSTVGRAEPGPDGVSTRIAAAPTLQHRRS